MRRTLLLVLIACLCAATLFATGGAQKSGAAAGPYQLTFWTFQDVHRQFMEDAAKSWNQKNPDR